MRVVGLTLIGLVLAGCQPSTDAEKVAYSFEQAARTAGSSAICEVLTESKTIKCIINASDREAEGIATGVIRMVHRIEVDLSDWQLNLVTLDGYTVTKWFWKPAFN